MQPIGCVKVSIELARVRQNAEAILQQTGVPLIAVVKCDAYGLGADAVAAAIGDLVEAFYVFDAAEAIAGDLWDITQKRTIALHGTSDDAADYLSHHIHPVIWSEERATLLRQARPVLAIDTGQQRFSCSMANADLVRKAGDCSEVMTHAIRMEQVDRFAGCCAQWERLDLYLHAAGSALLTEPDAYLDAVRPGLALYRGAVHVSTHLVEVRDSAGPAGYTGFVVERFGVILVGYAAGLRRGPCLINGTRRQIMEVGMQSAFVEIGPTDSLGDEVILMGASPEIDEIALAKAQGTSPQDILVRMTGLAARAD